MCFVLSIIMANVIIHFDGMFVSSVSGQSSEKESDEGSIVIKDPKLKAELIVSGLEFPPRIPFIDKSDFLMVEKETGLVKHVTGIESRQGDQLKNIEDKNTTNNDTNNNNNNNNNNDLSMCNKLKSFDKVLSDTWIERKITDEQVMYLGQEVKQLMVEAGCMH